MKLKTACPTCGKPITLARILAAPHPWGLKCPHSRSKAKVKNHSTNVILGFTIIIFWGILILFLSTFYSISLWHLIAVLLLSGFLLELSFSLWVVNTGLRHY